MSGLKLKHSNSTRADTGRRPFDAATASLSLAADESIVVRDILSDERREERSREEESQSQLVAVVSAPCLLRVCWRTESALLRVASVAQSGMKRNVLTLTERGAAEDQHAHTDEHGVAVSGLMLGLQSPCD